MNSDCKISDKAKAVYFLARQYPYSRRIVLSDGSIGSADLRKPSDIQTELQIGRKEAKPHGLWYAFGGAWAEFLWENDYHWSYKRLDDVTHIYALRLNYEHIYRIRTIEQFERFESRFVNKPGTRVNWEKVARKWAGIEIKFLSSKANGSPPWYEDWDVSSGCIWHREAVRAIRVLHKWEVTWTKVI